MLEYKRQGKFSYIPVLYMNHNSSNEIPICFKHFTVIDKLSGKRTTFSENGTSLKVSLLCLQFGALCPSFETYHANDIQFMASTKEAEL